MKTRQSLRDKQLQTSRIIDENIKLRDQLNRLRQAAADLVGSRSLLSKTHCRQDEFAARIEALLEEIAP